MYELPQILSFHHFPALWIGSSAVLPDGQVDFDAMAEELYIEDLPLSKLRFRATRDGEFCIDFARWPPGRFEPMVEQPCIDDAFSEIYWRVTGARNLVVNAFLICLASASIGKAYPRFSRVMQSQISSKCAIDGRVSLAATNDFGMRAARRSGSYSAGTPARDHRIADRVTTLPVERVIKAAHMLDHP